MNETLLVLCALLILLVALGNGSRRWTIDSRPAPNHEQERES